MISARPAAADVRRRRRRRERRRRAIAGDPASGVGRSRDRRRHAAPPRSARFTALRTRMSFSLDARRSASLRARRVLDASERHGGAGAYLGVLPLAEESTCAFSMPSSGGDARIAAQRTVRLEQRHLLGEVGVAQRLALHGRLDLRQRPAGDAFAASARTAATRTSRSASSMPRSRDCSAPGEPISPSACTAREPQRRVALGEQPAPARATAAGVCERAGAPHRLERDVPARSIR